MGLLYQWRANLTRILFYLTIVTSHFPLARCTLQDCDVHSAFVRGGVWCVPASRRKIFPALSLNVANKHCNSNCSTFG